MPDREPKKAGRKPRRLEKAALWEYALRVLCVQARSAGEVREKLLRRAENADDVPEMIERLREYGYLDDKRFAESYSTLRLENQGLGQARVLHDLRKRRVAPAVAQKAVSGVYRDVDEMALIEAYLQRKFRGKVLHEWLAEPKNLAGAYRRLRMAGFSASHSVQVLKRFAREPEALDALENEEEPE